jgi:Na+-transporting NADH:ubiquinone oxidoreductase subunit B
MNVFNPALLARAFAFFAYTPQMSGEKVWYAVDGATGATALDAMLPAAKQSAEHVANMANFSVSDAFWGTIPGCVGETSTFAILLGAALLLFTGVASWRIMLSVFLGGFAFAYLFEAMGPNALFQTDYPAYYHLLVGGFAFGAVFMATDPVTSAQTNTGKWIYGFMIGALAICVRVMNPAYPEGMMLAILFMNALAPLIDYFVVERNIARRKKLIKNVK